MNSVTHHQRWLCGIDNNNGLAFIGPAYCFDAASGSAGKLINVLGEKYTILWRSAYGNRYKVGGEEIRDVKIYKRGPLLPISYNKEDHDLPYLSNADNSFDLIKDFLIANFPDKSIYEK